MLHKSRISPDMVVCPLSRCPSHKPTTPDLTRRPRDATPTEPHVCAFTFEPPHTEKLRQRRLNVIYDGGPYGS